MPHPRALALALSLAVCGCAAAPDPQPDAPGATRRGDRPTDHWLGRWELIRTKLLESAQPAEEVLLRRGTHVELIGLRVAGQPLAAPTRAAAEVLIVMEGRGLLRLPTGSERLEPGTVALLPAGARGELLAQPGPPLLALAARALAATGGGEPRVLRDLEVLPAEVTEPRKGNRAHLLGSLPGGLSVRAVGVSGEIEPHFHREHDELVLLLAGSGELGVGSESGTRAFVVQPFVERALVLLPAGTPHGYVDKAAPYDRTVALSIHAPDITDDADRHPLQQRPQEAGGTRFR